MTWFDEQRAWDGKPLEREFTQWVQDTRKCLLRAFPVGEQNFTRIVDKLRFHLSPRGKSLLLYKRQKPFAVAHGVVFFADFYFKPFKLAVEIDGRQHGRKLQRARDEWKSLLIGKHGIVTLRFMDDELINCDWQQIEQRFINAMFSVDGRGRLKASLARELARVRRVYTPTAPQEQN